MDEALKTGDIVILNSEYSSDGYKNPQMVVKEVVSDNITCTYFNPITYEFVEYTFRADQLELINPKFIPTTT